MKKINYLISFFCLFVFVTSVDAAKVLKVNGNGDKVILDLQGASSSIGEKMNLLNNGSPIAQIEIFKLSKTGKQAMGHVLRGQAYVGAQAVQLQFGSREKRKIANSSGVQVYDYSRGNNTEGVDGVDPRYQAPLQSQAPPNTFQPSFSNNSVVPEVEVEYNPPPLIEDSYQDTSKDADYASSYSESESYAYDEGDIHLEKDETLSREFSGAALDNKFFLGLNGGYFNEFTQESIKGSPQYGLSLGMRLGVNGLMRLRGAMLDIQIDGEVPIDSTFAVPASSVSFQYKGDATLESDFEKSLNVGVDFMRSFSDASNFRYGISLDYYRLKGDLKLKGIADISAITPSIPSFVTEAMIVNNTLPEKFDLHIPSLGLLLAYDYFVTDYLSIGAEAKVSFMYTKNDFLDIDYLIPAYGGMNLRWWF